jgi:hypothetical protein
VVRLTLATRAGYLFCGLRVFSELLPSYSDSPSRKYLITRSLDPIGRGQVRLIMRWKPVINAFAFTLGDRFPAAETY